MEPVNFFWLLLSALDFSILLVMGLIFFRDLKESKELQSVFIIWGVVGAILLFVGLVT